MADKSRPAVPDNSPVAAAIAPPNPANYAGDSTKLHEFVMKVAEETVKEIDDKRYLVNDKHDMIANKQGRPISDAMLEARAQSTFDIILRSLAGASVSIINANTIFESMRAKWYRWKHINIEYKAGGTYNDFYHPLDAEILAGTNPNAVKAYVHIESGMAILRRAYSNATDRQLIHEGFSRRDELIQKIAKHVEDFHVSLWRMPPSALAPVDRSSPHAGAAEAEYYANITFNLAMCRALHVDIAVNYWKFKYDAFEAKRYPRAFFPHGPRMRPFQDWLREQPYHSVKSAEGHHVKTTTAKKTADFATVLGKRKRSLVDDDVKKNEETRLANERKRRLPGKPPSGGDAAGNAKAGLRRPQNGPLEPGAGQLKRPAAPPHAGLKAPVPPDMAVVGRPFGRSTGPSGPAAKEDAVAASTARIKAAIDAAAKMVQPRSHAEIFYRYSSEFKKPAAKPTARPAEMPDEKPAENAAKKPRVRFDIPGDPAPLTLFSHTRDSPYVGLNHPEQQKSMYKIKTFEQLQAELRNPRTRSPVSPTPMRGPNDGLAARAIKLSPRDKAVMEKIQRLVAKTAESAHGLVNLISWIWSTLNPADAARFYSLYVQDQQLAETTPSRRGSAHLAVLDAVPAPIIHLPERRTTPAPEPASTAVPTSALEPTTREPPVTQVQRVSTPHSMSPQMVQEVAIQLGRRTSVPALKSILKQHPRALSTIVRLRRNERRGARAVPCVAFLEATTNEDSSGPPEAAQVVESETQWFDDVEEGPRSLFALDEAQMMQQCRDSSADELEIDQALWENLLELEHAVGEHIWREHDARLQRVVEVGDDEAGPDMLATAAAGYEPRSYADASKDSSENKSSTWDTNQRMDLSRSFSTTTFLVPRKKATEWNEVAEQQPQLDENGRWVI